MFFGPHRAAFLEFLRNLSPQIMLLTIALVASSGLDMTHLAWTWAGIQNVWPLAAVIAVFCAAAVANVTQFLEEMTDETPEVKAALERERDKYKGRNFRLFVAHLATIWRFDKASVGRWLVALLVVEIGMAALFIMAIPAATAVVDAIHPRAHKLAHAPAETQKALPAKS